MKKEKKTEKDWIRFLHNINPYFSLSPFVGNSGNNAYTQNNDPQPNMHSALAPKVQWHVSHNSNDAPEYGSTYPERSMNHYPGAPDTSGAKNFQDMYSAVATQAEVVSA